MMNRIIVLLFVIILAMCHVSAQTLDSIAHHVLGYYGPQGSGQWENILHLSDGNLLFNHLESINANGQTTPTRIGNVYYKISRHGAEIMDSLVIYDNDPSWFLFAKNPNNDDDHIRVGIVHDSVIGSSFLQIIPFDNDMCFDSLHEVFVPLSDSIVLSSHDSYLINKHNELVFNYLTECGNNKRNWHFACFGLDGMLKHENVMPEAAFPMNYGYCGLSVFNESPLEYCVCGVNRPSPTVSTQTVCYVFDSLFQYKDSFSIPEEALCPEIPQLKYNFGWMDCMIVDDDDFIVGSRYVQGAQNGACLVRYDKHSLEQKDAVLFPSRPMIYNNSLQYGACPIGLDKDSEGSLYFSYQTQQPLYTDKGQIAVVKVDSDFNVRWERFCLEPEGYHRIGDRILALDDGGAAVCGGYWWTDTRQVFLLIVSDDYDSMEEQGFIVRPYTYYPNPVQDELHLQFSPDVTPKQIELYDLQGRLVKTQRYGLENLNLEGLASGAYTMRVTLEDGKVFSDKVVKE